MIQSFNLHGMTCTGCKASVEKQIAAIHRISKVEADLTNATVTFQSDKKITVKDLQKVLPNKYKVTESKKQLNVRLDDVGENDRSIFLQLYPLFLIFFFITTASVLLSVDAWNASAFMQNFMGLFYVVFSFFKFLDVKGFANSFKMYDPLAKKIKGYGFVYPFIELILGLFFLYGFQIEIALYVTIGILGVTTVGVLQSLVSKQTIKCACLGSVLNLPMTKATFIENSIMIIMAIFMLISLH